MIPDMGSAHYGQEELPEIYGCHIDGNVGLFDLHADRQLVDPHVVAHNVGDRLHTVTEAANILVVFRSHEGFRDDAFLCIRRDENNIVAGSLLLLCIAVIPERTMTAVFGCHKYPNRPGLAGGLGVGHMPHWAMLHLWRFSRTIDVKEADDLIALFPREVRRKQDEACFRSRLLQFLGAICTISNCDTLTSTFLHVNCFFIEKKLLYPNVKDSIIILPWIDPISDHNEFSK